MTIQQRIAAAKAVLDKNDGTPWTADEMAVMRIGQALQQLMGGLQLFESLIHTNPDIAVEVVNEFKQTSEFATLLALIGP